MSNLATTEQENTMLAIKGITENLVSLQRTISSARPLEVHPQSNSIYKDIESLSKALTLLAAKARHFYEGEG